MCVSWPHSPSLSLTHSLPSRSRLGKNPTESEGEGASSKRGWGHHTTAPTLGECGGNRERARVRTGGLRRRGKSRNPVADGRAKELEREGGDAASVREVGGRLKEREKHTRVSVRRGGSERERVMVGGGTALESPRFLERLAALRGPWSGAKHSVGKK